MWFSNDCFKLTYVVDQHVVEKNFDHVVSSRAILSTLTGLASSLAWFSSPSSDCLCIFGLCSAMCIDIFLLHFSFTFTWWDWPSTWLTNHRPSVLWHCWLGHVTRKTVSEMTYSVSSWTLNTTIPCLSLLMPSWHWTAPAIVLCLFGASATWLHWLCGAWMVKQSENSGDRT